MCSTPCWQSLRYMHPDSRRCSGSLSMARVSAISSRSDTERQLPEAVAKNRLVVPIRDPMQHPSHPERDLTDRWTLWDIGGRTKLSGTDLEKIISSKISNAGNNAFLAAKRSHEMLTVSRMYFDRAIDGHRKALANLSVENIEAGKQVRRQNAPNRALMW